MSKITPTLDLSFKPFCLYFFALAYERISIKTHSTEFENKSYRTRKSTVCRRICASFSLEILQAWAYTFNPFSAQTCKMSRLNDAQTRICNPFNAQAYKMSRLNDAQTRICNPFNAQTCKMSRLNDAQTRIYM